MTTPGIQWLATFLSKLLVTPIVLYLLLNAFEKHSPLFKSNLFRAFIFVREFNWRMYVT